MARFMARVHKTETCWLWTGATGGNGYGRFTVGGRRTAQAHAVAYEWFVGPIGGLHVLHRCDVPACVNPSHLFLGSQAENMADMVAKGRSARGERGGRAKLTATDIPAIRAAYAAGSSTVVLSNRYGVSAGAITEIVRGRNWRHV